MKENDDHGSSITESEHREVKPVFTELELTLIGDIINSIINPADLRRWQNAPKLVAEIFGCVLRKLQDSPDVERYISVMAHSHEDDVIYFITKMSQEKKVLLARVIASEVPFDIIGKIKAQERFKRISKLCGLPWEIANETLIKTYNKWYYAITRYCAGQIEPKRYCFETREVAERAIKFLSSKNEIEEWWASEGDDANVHVWSFDEFKASIEKERRHEAEQALAQWYARPAFIAESVDVYCKRVQENAARNRGLLGSTTSSRLRTQQQTGCLVPLVVCMTGLVLSCVVVAIGVAMVSNL